MSFYASPSAELNALKVSMDTVALSVNEIKVELRHSTKALDSLRDRFDAHEKAPAHVHAGARLSDMAKDLESIEKRLRALEQGR